MLLQQVLTVLELLDAPDVAGADVAELLRAADPAVEVRVERVTTPKGRTDFVRAFVPGSRGRAAGGTARTLGVVGRLGGIGARPSVTGLVSDADGAIAALAAALKLARMHARGDVLEGDVVVTTHVCPDAPTVEHDPVPFMGSPVDMATMNAHEVDAAMDAVLSIDTTRGNRVLNANGIAITPTVRRGWILHPSRDLLTILETVTGAAPLVLPIAVADITPYGNGLDHINSLLQPATATDAPVVGLALTSAAVVAGSATGANREMDVAMAATFALEAAKAFTKGSAEFQDAAEYERLERLYGAMTHLQGPGAAG